MAIFHRAVATLDAAKARIDTLQGKVRQAKALLDDIGRAARIASALDASLARISAAANTAAAFLALPTPIPGPWRLVIAALKRTLRSLLNAIRAAISAIRPLLAAIEEALARLRPPVDRARAELALIEAALESLAARVATLRTIAAFLASQQEELEPLIGPEWIAMIAAALDGFDGINSDFAAAAEALGRVEAELRPYVDELRQKIDAINALADRVEAVAVKAERLAEAATSLRTYIEQAFAGIPPWASRAVEQAARLAGEAWERLRNLLPPPARNWVEGKWNEIRARIDQSGIREKIQELEAELAQALDPLSERLREASNILGAVQRLVGEIQTAIAEATERVQEFGQQLQSLEALLGIVAIIKIVLESLICRLSVQVGAVAAHLAKAAKAGRWSGEENAAFAAICDLARRIQFAAKVIDPAAPGAPPRGDAEADMLVAAHLVPKAIRQHAGEAAALAAAVLESCEAFRELQPKRGARMAKRQSEAFARELDRLAAAAAALKELCKRSGLKGVSRSAAERVAALLAV